jgi:hypothetical protein
VFDNPSLPDPEAWALVDQVEALQGLGSADSRRLGAPCPPFIEGNEG